MAMSDNYGVCHSAVDYPPESHGPRAMHQAYIGASIGPTGPVSIPVAELNTIMGKASGLPRKDFDHVRALASVVRRRERCPRRSISEAPQAGRAAARFLSTCSWSP